MLDLLLSLDSSLFLRLNALSHPGWLNVIMLAISAIGAGAGIWFALGVVVTFRNDAGAAWRLLLALLVTIATVDLVLKPTFARTRPYVAHAGINVEGPLSMTYSFPSGHAATAAAGALGLSRVWSHATPALWALALLIAGSRVYLGVHYPGDVLFGLLVGCGCAYFVTGGMAYKSRRSSVMNSRRSWMFGRQSAVGRQVSPCTLSLSGLLYAWVADLGRHIARGNRLVLWGRNGVPSWQLGDV